MEWSYHTSGPEGQGLEIDGIDVWSHPWIEKKSEPLARVKDPAYGQEFQFHVYEIASAGKRIRFAAGEFSNGYWGFYVADRLPNQAR